MIENLAEHNHFFLVLVWKSLLCVVQLFKTSEKNWRIQWFNTRTGIKNFYLLPQFKLVECFSQDSSYSTSYLFGLFFISSVQQKDTKFYF